MRENDNSGSSQLKLSIKNFSAFKHWWCWSTSSMMGELKQFRKGKTKWLSNVACDDFSVCTIRIITQNLNHLNLCNNVRFCKHHCSCNITVYSFYCFFITVCFWLYKIYIGNSEHPVIYTFSLHNLIYLMNYLYFVYLIFNLSPLLPFHWNCFFFSLKR